MVAARRDAPRRHAASLPSKVSNVHRPPSGPLAPAVVKVLASKKQPMNVRDILAGLLTGGYHFQFTRAEKESRRTHLPPQRREAGKRRLVCRRLIRQQSIRSDSFIRHEVARREAGFFVRR